MKQSAYPLVKKYLELHGIDGVEVAVALEPYRGSVISKIDMPMIFIKKLNGKEDVINVGYNNGYMELRPYFSLIEE